MAAMVTVAAAALLFSVFCLGSSLSVDYYAKTYPKVDKLVTAAVKLATLTDKTVPAALLRMHFHDYFIDLAPAFQSGGPSWEVPKGRKDGRVSKASDTIQLLAPTFNFSQLKQNFVQRGLKTIDLVALSGDHTLGFAHCSSFQNRIHDFDNTHDVDPFLQPSFTARLRHTCPAHNTVKNAGATMDSTTAVFDNVYYKMLLQGQSLFTLYQTLLSHPRTRALVTEFAGSQKAFNDAFVKSMIKMGSLTGGQEVRLECKFVR